MLAHRVASLTSPLSEARVVVTGGSGFLGSHVCDGLRAGGCDPFVPRSVDYDLTDIDAVRRLIADAQPDVILNLAARVGGIGANQRNPGAYFYDNLMIGALLIEQARQAGVEKFVQIGTVCSYPKHARVPFREDDLWDGYPEETNAPYGVANKALLVQAQAYRQQYGMNVIFLMPVNLYGPRDNFELETSHVIPALIRRMVEAQETNASEVVLWGDGSPSREFLYIDDCAEAIVLATERYNKPDPVNVGAGFEITIRELAELIRELVGYEGGLVWDRTKPNGQPRRCLDTSRAEREFGFRAKTPFREGLERTVTFFRLERDWISEDAERRRVAERRAASR